MLISGHTAFLALESVDGKSLYFDPYYKPSPGAKTHTREGVVVRVDTARNVEGSIP